MICCPMLLGCVFASNGGLLLNICSSSGVLVSIVVGLRSLLRGICSRSGPSVIANVGRVGLLGSFCLFNIAVRLWWIVNRGVRNFSG